MRMGSARLMFFEGESLDDVLSGTMGLRKVLFCFVSFCIVELNEIE